MRRRGRRRTGARPRSALGRSTSIASVDLGEAEDLDRLLERRRGEGQRALVLGALVAGPVALAAVRAPGARVQAGRLDAAVRDRLRGREVPRPLLRVAAAATRARTPSARGAARGAWPARRVLHPHAQPRLVHDPRLDALQVLVEPAQALLQEADRRAGLAVLREGVRPRADEALARAGQALDQPRDRVAVAVGPAADRVHRDVDRLVVLAHRALAPVGVAALVGEPRLDERRRVLDALQPRLAPAVADDGLVGRQGVAGEHRRRPREHVDGEHAAADVVDVVGVAVVAGAHRDDRLQRRRAARRDLQAVEAAPRDAEHADRAAAPRLLGQPGDDVDRVLLLLGQVLVLDDPVGVAACRAGRRARPRSRGRRSRGGGASRARAKASPLR